MKVLRMMDTDLRNKRVLIREDLNVPVQEGVVTSDARIRAALATIRYALDQHARVFIMSHLGRPQEGQEDPKLTLAPVAIRLSELLGKPVPLRKNWIDGVDCAPGSAVLCENVRFLKGEKKDDEQLARRLAALCDGIADCRRVPLRDLPPNTCPRGSRSGTSVMTLALVVYGTCQCDRARAAATIRAAAPTITAKAFHGSQRACLRQRSI